VEIEDCIEYHRISFAFDLDEIERAVVEKTIEILERVRRLEEVLDLPENKPFVSYENVRRYLKTGEEW
jgi:hypothetical protein